MTLEEKAEGAISVSISAKDKQAHTPPQLPNGKNRGDLITLVGRFVKDLEFIRMGEYEFVFVFSKKQADEQMRRSLGKIKGLHVQRMASYEKPSKVPRLNAPVSESWGPVDVKVTEMPPFWRREEYESLFRNTFRMLSIPCDDNAVFFEQTSFPFSSCMLSFSTVAEADKFLDFINTHTDLRGEYIAAAGNESSPPPPNATEGNLETTPPCDNATEINASAFTGGGWNVEPNAQEAQEYRAYFEGNSFKAIKEISDDQKSQFQQRPGTPLSTSMNENWKVFQPSQLFQHQAVATTEDSERKQALFDDIDKHLHEKQKQQQATSSVWPVMSEEKPKARESQDSCTTIDEKGGGGGYNSTTNTFDNRSHRSFSTVKVNEVEDEVFYLKQELSLQLKLNETMKKELQQAWATIRQLQKKNTM